MTDTYVTKVEMTRSQQMALLDVLVSYARDPSKPQLFVDCSNAVETSTGDLIQLIHGSGQWAVVQR